MTNVLIIHGTKGDPDANWFPWLKAELEKLGCSVLVPRFPTPKNQSLESWLKVLESYKGQMDQDTILVGHSIASAFILSALQRLDHPVKAAFLVSGFLKSLGIPDYDELNKSFVTANFDWPRIRQNCSKFYVINSDNDPYIPSALEEGRKLAEKLGTKLTVLKNAGHINAESGYTHFELLLELVKKELQA